jgi:hypothetical protein
VTFNLPPHLLAALVPLLVLLVALDVYCLVDLARARSMGVAAYEVVDLPGRWSHRPPTAGRSARR